MEARPPRLPAKPWLHWAPPSEREPDGSHLGALPSSSYKRPTPEPAGNPERGPREPPRLLSGLGRSRIPPAVRWVRNGRAGKRRLSPERDLDRPGRGAPPWGRGPPG